VESIRFRIEKCHCSSCTCDYGPLRCRGAVVEKNRGRSDDHTHTHGKLCSDELLRWSWRLSVASLAVVRHDEVTSEN